MTTEIEHFSWSEKDSLAKEYSVIASALQDESFTTVVVTERGFTPIKGARKLIKDSKAQEFQRFVTALFQWGKHLELALTGFRREEIALDKQEGQQRRTLARQLDRLRQLIGMDMDWRSAKLGADQILTLLDWANATTPDLLDWLERPLKAALRSCSCEMLQDGRLRRSLELTGAKCAESGYVETRKLAVRIQTILLEWNRQENSRVESSSIPRASSPKIDEKTRKAVTQLLASANSKVEQNGWRRKVDVDSAEGTKGLLSGSAEMHRAAILIVTEQVAEIGKRIREESAQTSPTWYWNLDCKPGFPVAGMEICRKLLRRKLTITEDDLGFLLETLGGIGGVTTWTIAILEPIVALLEKAVEAHGLRKRYLKGIELLHEALSYISNAPERKLRDRLRRIIEAHSSVENVGEEGVMVVKLSDVKYWVRASDAKSNDKTSVKKTEAKGGRRLPLHAGEAWSDAAISDVHACDDELQEKWFDLLMHCLTAKSAAPTAAWTKKAREHLKAIGYKRFTGGVRRWFALVDEPRTSTLSGHYDSQPDPNELIIEPHMDILRGLAWCCALKEDKEVARSLAELARSCYRKVPLIGPRAVRVGNAAVTALGMMPGMEGVYQLAYLKVKVKFGTAQKTIEKAFDTAAKKAGLPRDEIEELAVPSYGLTGVGVAEEKLGEFTARLRVTGTTSTEIEWVKGDGKLQKGVPAVVKEKFGEELKELKAAAKDIERMLPAQRERIDTMFLQEKEWPVGVWRERYLDHPLVGVLARRLLWEFQKGSEKTTAGKSTETARQQPRATEQTETGIWYGGKVVDLDLREIPLDGDVTVRLWHPIGKEIEEVMAWREWLDAQQIQQPFKQAHREVYVLTEAERRTRTYSNRYAAHVLKQHQFNALCALRGWKNKLRMMVDDEYPPATLHLPKWGLRAEFWIEGAGTEYGTDTNESGAFLRVTTDQVRFYREGALQRTAHAGGGGYHPGFGGRDAEPLALEEIPPLVFSEVMRDVDMFVGVASVGNDPTWSDGGPNGQYRDYWGAVSFGELNGSAKTRKEVLERLVPRLKIGKLCSFEDRFLVVKGKLRAYRIHLGSGNILMEPNDQYLCIVPKQGEVEDGKVLLPFEGDRTLSVILSKAFLLAADDKIKDETITRQIKIGK